MAIVQMQQYSLGMTEQILAMRHRRQTDGQRDSREMSTLGGTDELYRFTGYVVAKGLN